MGVKVPPPPSPPTFARNVTSIRTIVPMISVPEGGHISSFFKNYV